MTGKNLHVGSSFESWLDDHGIREEAESAAIKSVIAHQLLGAMHEQGISKSRMAEMMKTSRSQLDRLLSSDNHNVTLETLQRAAKIVSRQLRLELI